jgi:hypothetical protein
MEEKKVDYVVYVLRYGTRRKQATHFLYSCSPYTTIQLLRRRALSIVYEWVRVRWTTPSVDLAFFPAINDEEIN